MNDSENIAVHLAVRAREEPLQPALISRGTTLTYRELEQESNQCARGLKHLGIQRGSVVVLMVQPGCEFLILTFGLIKIGAIPVFVDPGMGWKNLGRCLNQAAPEAFIGVPRAHLARILFGWARSTIKLCVTVGGLRAWSGYSFTQLMKKGATGEFLDPIQMGSTEPAAIVFTSGSTGLPKGVVYTHRILSSQVALLRDHFGIEPGEVNLATFPLFALFDPALRMTTVFPQMDFSRPTRVDPAEIVRMVQTHQVTHMFGSPALLHRVGLYGEESDLELPTLKRVLSAGAPVSTKVLRRVAKMLGPDADIHTPYGATEALPVCSISSREVLREEGSAQGKGVCVGRPLPDVHLAVVRITDDPIEHWSDDLRVGEGEIGELIVWGPNVSSEYWGQKEANRQAKIQAPDQEIRHRMGDVGYLDSKGRVWFCGRKSHRVITSAGTLFTVPCEGIYNQHSEVYRSALVGVGRAPNQRPVLCVELEKRKHWKGSDTLKREILALGADVVETAQINTLLFHPDFPVDARHNAKIFREKLALWAGEQLS